MRLTFCEPSSTGLSIEMPRVDSSSNSCVGENAKEWLDVQNFQLHLFSTSSSRRLLANSVWVFSSESFLVCIESYIISFLLHKSNSGKQIIWSEFVNIYHSFVLTWPFDTSTSHNLIKWLTPPTFHLGVVNGQIPLWFSGSVMSGISNFWGGGTLVLKRLKELSLNCWEEKRRGDPLHLDCSDWHAEETRFLVIFVSCKLVYDTRCF